MVWLMSMNPGTVYDENSPHAHAALLEHVEREREREERERERRERETERGRERELYFITAFTGNQQPPFVKKSLISVIAGGITNTIVFWLPYWTTFEHASKLAPSFNTAAAKGVQQETVSAAELESAAQGCVNVKTDA